MASTPVSFLPVRGYPNRLKAVQKTFDSVLKPLYGSQTSALKKLFTGRDRKGRLACINDSPCGLIVYKLQPTDEYADVGVSNSLEIKSLFLIDAEKHSGKGLLQYVTQKANATKANTLHVTVSELVPESLRFFYRNGFRLVRDFPGKYIENVTEHLLAKSLDKKHELQKSMASVLPAAHHNISLREPYVRQILSGQKSVEGRLVRGMFVRMRTGDTVRFFCRRSEVTCRISRISKYTGFRDMLSQEGILNCLPNEGKAGLDAGVQLYHNIPNFQKDEAQCGVLALELQLIR